MAGTVIRREIRERSLFGKIVKWVFIGFNALMLIWLVSYLGDIGNLYNQAGSSAGQAGAAIGGTIGVSLIISLWAFGDLILGIFVLLTRGEKVIVEEGGVTPAPNVETTSAADAPLRPTSLNSELPEDAKINKWLLVGGLGVVLIVIGLAVSKGSNAPDSATGEAPSSSSESVAIPQPNDERNFVLAVKSGREAYDAAPNDMAKGGTRANRRSGVCSALNGSAQVDGWVGAIKTLSSNSNGKGVLEIDLGDGVVVGTWNNDFSDINHDTLLDQSSPNFQTASAMKVGDQVQFSGRFFRSDVDCVTERSLTLQGSMDEPVYIMRFASIGVPQPPAPAPVQAPVPVSPPAAEQPAPVASPEPMQPVPEANTPASPDQGATPDAAAPPAQTQSAVSPSFNCSLARTQAERLVCSNTNLASLDIQVSSMYRAARSVASDPTVILGEQRQWLDERNACATVNCLVASYNRRKADLAQWVGPNR